MVLVVPVSTAWFVTDCQTFVVVLIATFAALFLYSLSRLAKRLLENKSLASFFANVKK